MSTEAVMREFYFNCNNCGQKLSCDASMLGEDVACPVCGNIIHLESNKHIQECAATNKVQNNIKELETPQKQNVTYGIKGTKVRTLTKTDNKKPFFSSSNIGCACLCIGLYLILLLIDSCNDNSNATPTSSDAWYMAQQFIKQDLKAPTTAKFPYSSANGVKILDLGNGKFSVSGYVDAENSFGAKIRNYFTITIWKKPNSDTWYSSGIIWHR